MENGVPDAEDQIRPWLIVNVLRELHGLIAKEYDIRGYLHWTLTDNFEWNEGWKLRFGLVALDPETQLRTMRSSAKIFSDIVRGNGLASSGRSLPSALDHPAVTRRLSPNVILRDLQSRRILRASATVAGASAEVTLLVLPAINSRKINRALICP